MKAERPFSLAATLRRLMKLKKQIYYFKRFCEKCDNDKVLTSHCDKTDNSLLTKEVKT